MPWKAKRSADMPTRCLGKPGTRLVLPDIAWTLETAWILVNGIVVCLTSVSEFVLHSI